MTLPDFLTEHPFGAVRLTGTRIDLGDVIELYKDGQTAELIQARFPHVPLHQIGQVITYYLEHRDAVDGYLKERLDAEERLLAAHTPSPALLRIRKLMEERG
jgi:uncharacterized protein (DUF433 family)